MPERSEYWGAADLEGAIQGLERHWYVLDRSSILAGKSLAQSNILRLSGATVMAIERDRLLVVGNFEEHTAFKTLFVPAA